MIRRLCPGSLPNQRIAIRAISENQDLLIEQRQKLFEIEQQRLDEIAKHEAKQLWLRREQYLQNERDQLRRKQEFEREKQRLAQEALAKKWAEEEQERLRVIEEKED